MRLDELVAEAVTRARLHAPATRDRARRASRSSSRRTASGSGRAVNNLLDNAVKHGPHGGAVEVRVTADGAVTVRDHGPGIAAGDREHVFDRFWRGADARARPGSGLGLAIVRQVAESHGGSVTVEDGAGRRRAVPAALPVAA